MDYLNVRPNTEQLRPQNHNSILCPKVPAKINGALWLLHWKGVCWGVFSHVTQTACVLSLGTTPLSFHLALPSTWLGLKGHPPSLCFASWSYKLLPFSGPLSFLHFCSLHPELLRLLFLPPRNAFPGPHTQTRPSPSPTTTYTQLLDSQHTLNFLFITLFFGIMIINNYNS